MQLGRGCPLGATGYTLTSSPAGILHAVTLKAELEAFAVRIGNLEEADAAKAGTISQQGLMIADLTQRLADCDETDPPPPPPPPPDDAVQIDPGDDLIKAINSEGVARPFLLLEGSHKLNAALPEGKNGIEIVGVNNPTVRGSGTGGHPFHKGTAKDGKLSGFTLTDFGPHNTGESGAILSGGDGWKLFDMTFRRTNNNFVALAQKGWEVTRYVMEDAGRYGFHGGPNTGSGGTAILRDGIAIRLGWKAVGVTLASDSNRGFSKFGRAKEGVKIFGLQVFDCYHGPWWDIANGGGNECWDLDVDGVARMGLNLEAGYFPSSGFKGGRIKIRNAGQQVQSTETNWPAPCHVQISLTGNVELSDLDLDDGRVGVGLINSKDHYQLTNSLNDRKQLGVGNVKLSGKLGSNWSKWGLATAGTAHNVYPDMRRPTGLDFAGLVVPSGVPVRRDW